MNQTELFKYLLNRIDTLEILRKDDELIQIKDTLKKLKFKSSNEEKKEELEKLIDYSNKVISETIINIQRKWELEEERETPKKLIRYSFSKEWHCPTCGSGNGEYEGTVGTHNYCHYCGQKLDWEEK